MAQPFAPAPGLAAEPRHHAVLVLAAGASRRLGRPKQLLRVGGISLLRHMAALALATRPARLVVVLSPQQAGMAQSLAGLPAELVWNAQADSGIASSLQAGARALADHHGPVLIMAVDQVRLAARHLERLLAAGASLPQATVLCQYADTAGLPALVSPAQLQESSTLHGDSGLKQLLLAGAGALVRVPAPELAFDVDTPAQLAEAVAQGWVDAA